MRWQRQINGCCWTHAKGWGMNNFILEFGQSIFAGLKNAFNFSDTASKREFWFFILFFFIAYVVVWILDEVFLKGAINLRNLPMGDFFQVDTLT